MKPQSMECLDGIVLSTVPDLSADLGCDVQILSLCCGLGAPRRPSGPGSRPAGSEPGRALAQLSDMSDSRTCSHDSN